MKRRFLVMTKMLSNELLYLFIPALQILQIPIRSYLHLKNPNPKFIAVKFVRDPMVSLWMTPGGHTFKIRG